MRVAPDSLQLVSERVLESIEVKRAILADGRLMNLVHQAAAVCVQALERGGKLILFGNGGSAADAQHLAAELTGRYLRKRNALPALSLTVNSSCLTAIGNDYSYDQVFSRQIEGLGRKGDVCVGISTSGNSANVIAGLRTARQVGLTTIGMTGKTGGNLCSETDICLCVPSDQTPRIQEAHILLGHILCEIIEANFC
jgi:D-sedoheptulose 7-phosphate isomerase